MQNPINITETQSLNDQIANDAWLDDKQQLVDRKTNLFKPKQAKQPEDRLKIDEKSFSDNPEKLDTQKQYIPKFFSFQNAVLCLLLMILVLLLSFAFFQKDLLRYMMTRLTQPKIQIQEETQPPRAPIKRPKCKEDQHMFRVYYNPSDKEMNKIGERVSENDECDLPVYGFWDLEEINEKWNIRYPNEQIDLNNIEQEQKEQLLVLYKLYFDGGIYINLSVPLWKISNRALKYALTGLDPIYADFSEKTQKGIYVPDPKKFMKVRAPYSPVIREMILKLAKNEDFLDRCKERQCLIVR